ncbi:MAG TPA: KTSC domain-containing protein [Acidimicrobiales bacterium]|nr:KTSC domain-containing protein [Acidimicrobiales bacterium]
MVRLQPVVSDAIAGYDYDPDTGVLTVAFRTGGVYEYDDVTPELADEFSQPHPWHRVQGDVTALHYRRIG